MKTIRSKTGLRQVYKDFKSLHPPKVEVCFLLQDWEDAYNVGGMFRVADGCGAKELIMTGRSPVPPNPMIGVTSMGQHRRIPFRHFESHEAAALQLKKEGWSIVVVEIAEGAENYLEVDFPAKTCLVLGNEANGVYGGVMKHRDLAVFIPMFGKGRSLNVHVAAAVIAFQAVLGTPNRLD
ncbi:MAG: tRNA methyltransferase [Armatimonadetes bacterium]|nr:tRNA methyltransferase [Armatimonadota bacterium]